MKTYTYSQDRLPPYWWLNPWSHVRRLHAAVVALRDLANEYSDTANRWHDKANKIEDDFLLYRKMAERAVGRFKEQRKSAKDVGREFAVKDSNLSKFIDEQQEKIEKLKDEVERLKEAARKKGGRS